MYFFFGGGGFGLDQDTSFRRRRRTNFIKGSFDWKLRGLVGFLIDKSDWWANHLSFRPTVSPNTFNRNWDSHFVQRSWKNPETMCWRMKTLTGHLRFIQKGWSYKLRRKIIELLIRIFSAYFQIKSCRRVNTPTPKPRYFPGIQLIEILRWPVVVVETSKRAHLIEYLKG